MMQAGSSHDHARRTQLPPIFAKFFEGCNAREEELRNSQEDSSEYEFEEEATNGAISSAEESTGSMVAVAEQQKGNAIIVLCSVFRSRMKLQHKAVENMHFKCKTQ